MLFWGCIGEGYHIFVSLLGEKRGQRYPRPTNNKHLLEESE